MIRRTHGSAVTTDPPGKPDPDPGPDVPPPDRPSPDVPKPGDPPGTPQPGDPPPVKPQPDKPGPVRPKSRKEISRSRTGTPARPIHGDGGPTGGNSFGRPMHGDGQECPSYKSWHLCALLVALLLASGTAHAQIPVLIDDDDILEAVEAELRYDDAVSADHLNVAVDAGVVTLSGKAFSLLAKRRAVRLIGSLKGVRAIIDRVEVVPNGRSDEHIFADVQAALRDDPVADPKEIQFTVGQGRVKLNGKVDSFAEKQSVETTVAGVRGVTEIENKLAILKPEIRSDKEIKPEILRRFELNPYLAEGRVDVEVDHGVVTLSGEVGSVNEKVVAGFLSWVAGVLDVDVTGLEVKPGQRHERRKRKFITARNDVELQRAVKDAMLYDSRVRAERINMRVREGAVSLSGDVASLAAKRAAERNAKNTLGVRRVINHLKVKVPNWPGDVEVTKRAQRALGRDAHLADFDLKASSHFGKVYIRGEVNTHFEKERAETVIANVPAALDVVNRITVDAQWEPKPDAVIQEDIERRLRWSPLLDAEEIKVSVDSGIVQLQGTVDTWHERTAASRHAFQCGARRVENKLDVRTQRGVPLGLKATLIPKQNSYKIDPKHSGKEFRKFLALSSPVRDPRRLPPAPEVDLVLKLHNQTEQPNDIRVGHDKSEIEMSLTGEGAVYVRLARAFTSDFRPGGVITIEPGEDFEIPIRSLQYGFRNAAERWYWTEPGEYMLQVTYIWPVDETGIEMQAVAAPPVPLKVTLSQEE